VHSGVSRLISGAVIAVVATAFAQTEEFDLRLIDMMIAHHQEAVDMVKEVAQRGTHAELKDLAQKMGRDQADEIRVMRSWRDAWYKGAAETPHGGMPGMHGHAPAQTPAPTGNFDVDWMDRMIPHHQDAITMAREALQKSRRPEIKRLAEQIIQTQQAEIDQMRQWKAKWSKG
jgi:uncharacterized protein (DUF305 family)